MDWLGTLNSGVSSDLEGTSTTNLSRGAGGTPLVINTPLKLCLPGTYTGTTPIRSSQSGTIHARSVSGYGQHTRLGSPMIGLPWGVLTVTVNRNHY